MLSNVRISNESLFPTLPFAFCSAISPWCFPGWVQISCCVYFVIWSSNDEFYSSPPSYFTWPVSSRKTKCELVRGNIRPFLSLCLWLCTVNLSHALVSIADQLKNRTDGCCLLGRVFSFLFFLNRYRGRVNALLRSLSEFIRAFTRK